MTTLDLTPGLSVSSRKSFAQTLGGMADHLFPSKWLWLLSAGLILFNAISIHFGQKFLINWQGTMFLLFYPLVAIPISWWLSQGNNAATFMARPLRLFMLPALLIPTTSAIATFDYIAMSHPWPLVHPMLTAWDQTLGFDWVAYATAVGHHPWVAMILYHSYNFMMQGLLLVIILATLQNKLQKANEIVALVMMTGIISISLGIFFPAISAMDYLGNDALKALYPPGTGNAFVQELLEVRGTVPKLISPVLLQGITQFPSYHIVCGILVAYGARGQWWSFGPALVFSGALIAATPICGGHYLVDLIAGSIIAGLSILAYRWAFGPSTREKSAIVNPPLPA